MDAVILAAVLPEIREALTGLSVTKIACSGKYGVLLHFEGHRALLFLSAHPELSRLGLVAAPPVEAPRRAPDALAEPLFHATLEKIEQEPNGRVVRLLFANEGRRHPQLELVGELIPRFANVVLVGKDDLILWSRREFRGPERPRQVAAGERYVCPAAESGQQLPQLDEQTIRERLAQGEGPLHTRLPRGWGGGPRGPARVFGDAGLDVAERLAALATACAAGRPHLARSQEDGRLHLFPADPGEIPGWEILPEAPPNETVDRTYRPLEELDAREILEAEIRRALVRRRARAAKALRAIENRLADTDSEPDVRHQAEVLAAHLMSAKKGMRSVRLPDFDGETEIEVPLDVKLEPQANLDALFRKARRLARGREDLESQHAIQEHHVAAADQGLEAVTAAPDLEALEQMADELHLAHPGRASRARAATRLPSATSIAPDLPPGAEQLPEGFTPRRYFLVGGWEVWVGRSARQNDELTHRHAAQRDLWFHARGCQGSHAVLRVGSGKGEPSKETIRQAAAIAAHHSKARTSGLVPVAYTEKRYVRKPRKSPAGTASMLREKVIFVEPWAPEGIGEWEGKK